MNLRPEIEKLNPKIIIFVKDVEGDVGQSDSFVNSEKYEQVAAWLGFSGHDVDDFNNGERPEADNIILIMKRRDTSFAQPVKEQLENLSTDEQEKYQWEAQLPPLSIGKIRDVDDFPIMHPEQYDVDVDWDQ